MNIFNYAVPGAATSPLGLINSAGLEKVVGTERWTLDASGSLSQLLDASINTYRYQNGQLSLQRLYSFIPKEPVPYTAYTAGGVYQQVNTAFTGNTPAHFRKVSEVVLADGFGNPKESYLPAQDIYKAIVWDTVKGLKLAEAAPARYADIAYASFDNTETDGNVIISRGNFSFSVGQVIFNSLTGTGGYKLPSGNAINVDLTGTADLTAGKEYLLSFWSTGGTPAVSIGGTSLPLPQASATATVLIPLTTWSNYIIRFTPQAPGRIRINAAGASTVYVDEVRLHPADATMQSWTYLPMFGPSSSTDPTGRITFYQYDALGRQTEVADQEGKVLSKTKQVVQGAQ